MTNLVNGAKKHENSVKNANHAESVGNILNNVENVPFALRGVTVKTILYFLFSFIAAVELTAALSFYTMSMGASVAVALVGCGLLAFGFHALLHGILSDTAKGIVFGKRTESGAMSNEVNVNIVLSIFLLIIASCTVFFVGKKGFTAYRATQYETAQNEAKPKGDTKGIDASMLTNKSGKIAAWKLEALTDLEKAKAKTTEATTAQTTADRQSYDATTATITDIVGASAFLIELLLALLAYSIATAKLAAVMDEIARRNGASQPTSQQAQATTGTTTANNTPSVTAQAASNTEPKKHNTYFFNDPSRKDDRDYNFVVHEFMYHTKSFDGFSMPYPFTKWDENTLISILEKLNVPYQWHGNDVFISDDVKRQIIAEYQKVTPPIEPPTAAPIQPKAIGFSDNKATKTGNEGRIIIQGFQRQNSEKTPITASVTDAVTDAVSEKEDSKLKMCLYCENEYIYRIHNQKYCSEECRIAAWNEKTGKQLRKISKA